VSFSDLRFIFYVLPAFVLLHALLPARARNALLLFGSLAVYAFFAGVRDAALLAVFLPVNYTLALWLGQEREELLRRALLILALALDLGVLFFFKYLPPLLAAAADEPSLLRAALPLGLSFYVFQAVSYLVDVSRGVVPAERDFLAFGAYLAAFPQLVMGPILRWGDLRAALRSRRVTRADLEGGFQLFVVGLGFKVLLADQLATLWAALERIGFAYLSAPLAWLGAFAYSLQLYFDFQGYSLMAIGLGRMLALPVARNFDLPYLSRSVSEFYRRWHMTLGAWFRDYVYIPLGGSRRGAGRTVCALAAVWLLTGLWHGASLNYLLWAGTLLALILLERFALRPVLARHPLLSRLYLLFVIPQTWVIFRITDLRALGAYFSRLYPFFGTHSAVFSGDFVKYLSSYWWLLALGVLFCLPWPRRFYRRHSGSALVWVPLFAVFWLSVYLLATGAGGPFLYFRF